ncbi:MAG TPA: nucleotidyltransferase [Verrucomicrobiae bacterium]|nr:nucleotidyltransferase [Verrucomicrobiae bacterium]
MAQNDQALLMRLKDSGLEFVVIGGLCVVYHGVPVATFDLDICCPFGEENVRKIESAVKDLNPVHRLTANKLPLEETRSSFKDLKNIYLQTDLGKLDCLGEVAGLGSYEQVLQQSILHSMSFGKFRMLNLDALIAAKAAAGRPKDLDAVRLLQAVKERKEQQKDLF